MAHHPPSTADQTLTCPRCGERIPLTSALRSEIERGLRAHYDQALVDQAARLQREHQATLEAERVRLDAERARFETEARASAARAVELEMTDLKACLAEQSEKLRAAATSELELRKRARDIEERERQLELIVERKLAAERTTLVAEAERRAAEAQHEKLIEKDRQLDQVRRQLDDLKRRTEQGSQEAQGEASELHLEAVLGDAFADDEIVPVPKGVRGADVCQRVRDRASRACGVIVWERKNTKNWSAGWVDKLRDDVQALKGDIGVIVSRVLPAGVTHFGFVDGVWVTEPGYAVPLAIALRAGLVDVARARRAALGTDETMQLIYTYVTGVEFRQRIQTIVSAVVRMKEDLDAERRSMERLWRKRAKEIERLGHNFAGIYGDLQGLAGTALPDVPALALPGEVARAEESEDERDGEGEEVDDREEVEAE